MGGRKRSSNGISDLGVGSFARRTYAEASCRQSGKFLEARYTVTVVLSEYAVIRPESMPSAEITSYKPTPRLQIVVISRRSSGVSSLR